MISLGIEQLINSVPDFMSGKRIGLLCNQASVDRNLLHSRDILNKYFPGQLTCLFSPQHGFFAEKQDNMIESDHAEGKDGLPVFSLYGDTRRPTREMFEHLDILLIDILDVGTRVYTFMSTLSYCLEEAARHGKQVVVLDRPNPVGGLAVEGNMLEADCASFVGRYPLPMRHGLTFGELALFINDHIPEPAELTVVKMGGWRRDMLYPDTELPWVYPSPNLPAFSSALVYPGQVIWEGTNISEGRGTTLPFELFGAPFIRHDEFLGELADYDLPGCRLRPVCFEPTSNKWANKVCTGFQLHVTDPSIFKPYFTSLVFLNLMIRLYGDQFVLKDPPYEYEFERLPLDLILGDRKILKGLQNNMRPERLEDVWQSDLHEFIKMRQKYLLYE